MIARVAMFLLVACCLRAAEGQSDGSRGPWDEPIQFSTKAKESCSMMASGQGDTTTLRVSCRGAERSYWCEYQGKPQACRAYGGNPRHYFTQIMWELRKLANACEGPRLIKPQMCRRATDDAQMAFSTASSPKPAGQKPGKPAQERLARAKHDGPPKTVTAKPYQAKSAHVKPGTARSLPIKPQPAKPLVVQMRLAQPEAGKKATKQKGLPKVLKTMLTEATTAAATVRSTDPAKVLAQDYCWESLQDICSYIIGWFHN